MKSAGKATVKGALAGLGVYSVAVLLWYLG